MEWTGAQGLGCRGRFQLIKRTKKLAQEGRKEIKAGGLKQTQNAPCSKETVGAEGRGCPDSQSGLNGLMFLISY